MRIVPFVHSFDPMEDGNTIQYSLTNTSDEPIAFEISIYRRKQDEDGADVLEKDDDSFQVFPTQIIIPANSTRNVRVKWVRNKEYEQHPSQEQAFRVVFDQYHIDLQNKRQKRKGASVDMRLQMLASLYMTPHGAKGEAVLMSVHEFNEKGKKIAKVMLQNQGTKRVLTNDLKIEIQVFGKKCKLCDVLSSSDRDGVIMAKGKRLFVIRAE